MLKIFFIIFLFLTASAQILAQCNGVYFKETNRQIFSNEFAYHNVEDIDGDGLNDLIGFSPTSNTNNTYNYQIYFYKRLSKTSFDTNAKISTINNFTGVFGDVNNDNKKDLIISTPNGLTTYLNDGSGRFINTTPFTTLLFGESVWAAGDLNNDGKADLVSSVPVPNSSTLYYRLAQADNTFGPALTIMTFPWFIQANTYNNQAIIEDINNDGLKDIVYRIFGGASGDKLGVAINNGTTFLDRNIYDNFPLYNESRKLKPIDFNNDGKKDFVSRPYSVITNPNIAKIKFLISNENGYADQEIIIPTSNYNLTNIQFGSDYILGDFDDNGFNDVIIQGDTKYLLLKNLGNSTFNQQLFNSYLTVNYADSIDADNKPDTFSLNRYLLNGSYIISSNNQFVPTQNSIRFRQNVCNPVGQTKTIDFNGDGLTDKAFWNPTTGVWRYYTDDTQTNQVYFQWGLGSAGDVPVPNDYDGDGITDYAVYRKPTGTWYIYRSSDQQYYAFPFGIAEDKPIPADFDGDGKADIAVYRPSQGNWYIWLSQTNQFYAANFGISEDKPLPADYDGDGKADISVYRPSSGTWYRLNSGSNNSFFAFQYGISTDKPIPTDYDGDGKANIAVFRDGIWFILREDYSTSVQYWGTTNDTPLVPESYSPKLWVYRRNATAIYDTTTSYNAFSTGNSFNETFVSNIIPE
jgi:hypothetical protein